MTLTQQILWGSLYLGASLASQIILMIGGFDFLNKTSARLKAMHAAVHNSALLTIALVLIVLSHTIQVWLWAGVFVLNDVLAD